MNRPTAARATSTALTIAALLLLTPPFVRAATATTNVTPTASKQTSMQRIRMSVARINAEATTPEGEAAVVDRLSKQLSVPPDSLRQEHADWTLGYGEIAMVYGFVRASKKPGITPAQVVEMRRAGRDWEAIAKEIGVKVDTVASRVTKNATPRPKPKHK